MSDIRKNYLSDRMVLTGDSKESFERVAAAVNANREIATLELNAVANDGLYELLSYDADAKMFDVLDPVVGVGKKNFRGGKVSVTKAFAAATAAGMSEEDFHELMHEALNTGLLLRAEGQPIFFSDAAIHTLSETVGIPAWKFDMAKVAKEVEKTLKKKMLTVTKEDVEKGIREFMISRDTCLYQTLFYAGNGQIRLSLVRFGGIAKAFAVVSNKYLAIPETHFKDVVEMAQTELGEPRYTWSISQSRSEVIVRFPAKAKEVADTYGIEFEPGLRLVTSYTKHESFRVEAIMLHGNFYATLYSASTYHKGRNERVSTLVEDVKKHIFDKYTYAPTRLCELMDEIVYDGIGGVTRGEKAVGAYLSRIDKAIGLRKAFGKQNSAKLRELLLMEFPYDKEITAFDVVTSLMEVPERIEGVREQNRQALADVLGKLLYVTLEEEDEEAEDLYLTA